MDFHSFSPFRFHIAYYFNTIIAKRIPQYNISILSSLTTILISPDYCPALCLSFLNAFAVYDVVIKASAFIYSFPDPASFVSALKHLAYPYATLYFIIYYHASGLSSPPKVNSNSSSAICPLHTRIKLSSASSLERKFTLPYHTIFLSTIV